MSLARASDHPKSLLTCGVALQGQKWLLQPQRLLKIIGFSERRRKFVGHVQITNALTNVRKLCQSRRSENLPRKPEAKAGISFVDNKDAVVTAEDYDVFLKVNSCLASRTGIEPRAGRKG
jgi:hypothetical protein